MRHSRAVQIARYGGPQVLVCRDVPCVPLAAGDIRIRTIAAAINHTDLKIRAGVWPINKDHPFPYTPGVEVVGTVVEVGAGVSACQPGQQVITMMQGLGGVSALRPGGYADLVTVAAEAAAVIPAGHDPHAIAAFGLPAVTAHQALMRLGPLSGRRLLVTGAAGRVGSAAVAMGEALGATVTAVVSRSEAADEAVRHGADDVLVIARDAVGPVPAGAYDAVIETVAGPAFRSSVEALTDNGTLCLVGAVGGGHVDFDAWQLIRPVRLTGYSTETLTGADLAHTLKALVDWLQMQALAVPPYRLMPLAQADQAHALLEQGSIRERVLLVP